MKNNTIFFLILLVSSFFFSCDNQKTTSNTENKPADTIMEIFNPPDSIPAEALMTDPKTLIDYFILLQQNEKADNNYRFVQNEGKWECYGKEEPDRKYPSVVDLKNGYLSIEDDGTGGGNYTTEMALFKRKNGTYIIAVNKYAGMPMLVHVDISSVSLRFYSYENKKLVEITQQVFPKSISGTDFSTANNAETLQTYYQLPAKGTVIAARYNESFCTSCKTIETQKESMDPESYQERVELCKACNKITKEKILIPFDKEKELFLPQ